MISNDFNKNDILDVFFINYDIDLSKVKEVNNIIDSVYFLKSIQNKESNITKNTYFDKIKKMIKNNF